MKPRKKKIIAAALAAALTASVFAGQVSAMQTVGTDCYMSGKYYRQLCDVKLSGDPRTDIVAIAKSQVGYQEGNSDDQLTGEIHGGKNFTEYGNWYGVQDMWCAMFVSWCADQAGVSTDIIPSHCATPEGLSWFAMRGVAYARADVQARKYTPKPGDIVYFKSSRNAKPTNHVGIVTAYSNGRIYTVEGNIGTVGVSTNGGMVAEKSYPITNNFIVYVCSPNYEGGSTSVLSDAQQQQQSLESLRQAMFAVETGDEFAYDAVNRDAGVSIGCGQWYGAQAAELLNRIYQASPEEYCRLDPQMLLLQEGALSRLTESQLLILRQVLLSDVSVRVQDEWMDQSLIAWMDRGKALGITDQDALLLCAALYQLRGVAVAERVIAHAGNAPGKETLLTAIRDLEPALYRTCCLLVA